MQNKQRSVRCEECSQSSRMLLITSKQQQLQTNNNNNLFAGKQTTIISCLNTAITFLSLIIYSYLLSLCTVHWDHLSGPSRTVINCLFFSAHSLVLESRLWSNKWVQVLLHLQIFRKSSLLAWRAGHDLDQAVSSVCCLASTRHSFDESNQTGATGRSG